MSASRRVDLFPVVPLRDINTTCSKMAAAVAFSARVFINSFYLPTALERAICRCRLVQNLQNSRSMAGHSHWKNIKFKKMHKDFARSKVFQKLSLEIITAVKEKGAEPSTNSKLASILLRAREANMPKDNIEKAIKSALRDKGEAMVKIMLEARGPGKCGLLIDVITPNVVRCRHELMRILKKQNCTIVDEGSVSFMFSIKGVVSVADLLTEDDGPIDETLNDKIQDMVIMSEADDYTFGVADSGNRVIQFVCDPEEVTSVHRRLEEEQQLTVVGSTVEQVAHGLLNCDQGSGVAEQAHRVICQLSDHPDVVAVKDNIRGYPSTTCKLRETS